jgi:hypothetical protein
VERSENLRQTFVSIGGKNIQQPEGPLDQSAFFEVGLLPDQDKRLSLTT